MELLMKTDEGEAFITEREGDPITEITTVVTGCKRIGER